MKLADLQSIFATAIRGRDADETAAKIAAGSEKMNALEQLEVYREQFWLRHVNCLAEDYPTLRALLGEEKFEELSARYLEAHPPTSFLLRDLGSNLADFVERSENDRLLTDVARTEWAYIDAFDAADIPPLDPSVITNLGEDDWPKVRIGLHPSVVLLDLEYPADELRAATRKGETTNVGLESDRRQLVVYRHQLLLYTERVDSSAFAVLSALAKGATLAEACACAADAEDKIGDWFTRWTALGWIGTISPPTKK